MADARTDLQALLGQLEGSLGDLGVALASHAAPGVTDAQLDAADQALGFRLPDDVRTLYRWHDGGVDRFAENARSPDLAVAPGWYLISLERAVEDHLWQRRFDQENYPEEESSKGHQQLFPLFQSITDATLVAVVDPHTQGSPPVDLLWEATDMPIETPGMASIGELVEVFVELASSGEVALASHGELDYVEGQVPTRLSHLWGWF